MKTLIVILGPTASGKTALSIQIARWLNTEIMNADSRQFYKGLNIGTAKPGQDELNLVPHHFIDSLSPEQDYSVGKFEEEGIALLNSLFENHDQVLMTGGSGLYIQAICQGLDQLPAADPLLRETLQKELDLHGIEVLQKKLATLDPEYYATVDKANPHRLIRALEVCIQSGEKYSSLRKFKHQVRPFNIIKIGLMPEKELLYERINKRVDQMIQEGLVEEARSFKHLQHLNALQTVGYRELFRYFNNEISLETAIEEIKKNTRRYAKRQSTWFRKDETIHWFNPEEPETIIKFLRSSLRLT